MVFLSGLGSTPFPPEHWGLPIPVEAPQQIPPQGVNQIVPQPARITPGGRPPIPMAPLVAGNRILKISRQTVPPVFELFYSDLNMGPLRHALDLVRPGGGARVTARTNNYISARGWDPARALQEALAKEIASTAMSVLSETVNQGQTYSFERLPIEAKTQYRVLSGLGSLGEIVLDPVTRALSLGVTRAVVTTMCHPEFPAAAASLGDGMARKYGAFMRVGNRFARVALSSCKLAQEFASKVVA